MLHVATQTELELSHILTEVRYTFSSFSSRWPQNQGTLLQSVKCIQQLLRSRWSAQEALGEAPAVFVPETEKQIVCCRLDFRPGIGNW